MREAAELARQRPSGSGVGVGDTCSRHVGLGTCCREACFSAGHLPHGQQGWSSKDDTGCLPTLKRVRGQGPGGPCPHTQTGGKGDGSKDPTAGASYPLPAFQGTNAKRSHRPGIG